MPKPNLLLSFDAFGTLFRPKFPIAQQYGQVARHLGITTFTDEQLHSSFRAAMRAEAGENPNYGREKGLGATTWWTNVIRRTFHPFLQRDQILPPNLAPTLLHRFSSSEGYETEPHLAQHLKTLKHRPPKRLFDEIVVGVVTNSDDRVPLVLASLGLDVSPLRYTTESSPPIPEDEEKEHHIDFHCMSYDVGVEKPNPQIFHAAERLLSRIISRKHLTPPAEANSWTKLHVGDEHGKDILGARYAGWNAVLLDADPQARSHDGIPLLADCPPGVTLEQVFGRHQAVRVRSVSELIKWLRGES